MNKKAKGHVEVIISFVIFIGFLIFILTIFNPLKISNNDNLSDSLLTNIQESLKVELQTISINLDNSPSACFAIDYIDQLNCSSIIVKDSLGNKVSASIQGNQINIQNSGSEKFYTIICSENLNEETSVSSCVLTSEYQLGVIVNRDPLAESKIMDFETSYNTDYENFKDDFITSGNDFAFTIWDLNNLDVPLYQGERNIPRGVSVNSKTIGIDVLDAEGNIKKRTINVRTW